MSCGKFFAALGGNPHLVAGFVNDPLAFGPLGLFSFELGFRLDIDSPPRQSRGEASILAFLADRQRKLMVIHHHRCSTREIVKTNFADTCWCKCVLNQIQRVIAVGDDVNSFATELIRHHAHTTATCADACTHRVNMWVVRPHGDLGAVTRLTSRSTNLDDARRNLGDLKLKETLDQTWVGPRHHDLRALGGFADFHDVGLETGAVLVALVGNLLCLRQKGLDATEVQKGVPVISLLDDAGDDVTLSTGVLVVLHVALDFTNALHDDLLGRLGGDTAEVLRGVIPFADHIALGVEFLAVDTNLAVFGVDRYHRLFGGVGQPLVGGDQCIGERVEQRVDADALVTGNLAQCIEEFEVGGAHGTLILSWVLVVGVRLGPLGAPAREGDGLGAGPQT